MPHVSACMRARTRTRTRTRGHKHTSLHVHCCLTWPGFLFAAATAYCMVLAFFFSFFFSLSLKVPQILHQTLFLRTEFSLVYHKMEILVIVSKICGGTQFLKYNKSLSPSSSWVLKPQFTKCPNWKKQGIQGSLQFFFNFVTHVLDINHVIWSDIHVWVEPFK